MVYAVAEEDSFGNDYDLNSIPTKVSGLEAMLQAFDEGKNVVLEEPIVIENPNATTDKTLVVFRDSFGSSLVPLLVQDYAKVTLVDIRAGSTSIPNLKMVDFADADVLFMYSSLVLNGGYI